jgi:phosphorylated CTD-interacting factor 1
MSLMDELSSQQGYEVPKTDTPTTNEDDEPRTGAVEHSARTQRRRLRQEIAGYPSDKPAGSRSIWNPYVKVVTSNKATWGQGQPIMVPSNPQVEVFRRRAYERFKEECKQIFERTNANSTKEGVSSLWNQLAVVSLMERWHFSVKLRETQAKAKIQPSVSGHSGTAKSPPYLEWNMQKVLGCMENATKQGWVDPVLVVDSNVNNKNQGQNGQPINLLGEEIKFDWLRAWRRAVNGKHKDAEVDAVFESKKFKKKVAGLSRAVKAAGYIATNSFNKDVVKRAELEATQTSRKRRNIPKLAYQEEEVVVSYSGLTFSINHDHFQKLQIMFDRQNQESSSREDHEAAFASSLFTLLARYDMIQGAGLQSAVQGAVFDVLLKHYGCNTECFASPLNCRYERFLSAFPDTDKTFGALGSFFNHDFTQGGAYQANPPFVADFIHAMYKKMDDSLSQCTKPLLFIVFVPAWVDTSSWKALKESKHLQKYVLLDQSSHYYAEGTQHRRKTAKRVASFDTSIFFLQNEAGKEHWKIQDSHIEDLKQAFMNDPEEEAEDVGNKVQSATAKKRKAGSSDSKNVHGKSKRKAKKT